MTDRDKLMTAIAETCKAGLDPLEASELAAIVLKHPERFSALLAGRRLEGSAREIGLQVLGVARQARAGGDA